MDKYLTTSILRGEKMGKKIILILLLSLLISDFSMATPLITMSKDNELISTQNVEEPNTQEYYALIIGIEVFVSGNLYPIEDKIDDGAIAMYNTLLESKNWKEENIKLLLNENATKSNIRDTIVGWLDDKEDENDVVLIYHAGHGAKIRLRSRSKGHVALYTYNVTEEHKLEDKITDIEYDSWVDELESQHITMIIDACHSGRMLALRQYGREILAAGGRFIFCGVDEEDSLGSGIFSYFVALGFKGLADLNNDGWVTSEEIFRFSRIPTICFSIWRQFPFVYDWMNRTIVWFFQVPTIFDYHPGSIKLYQYQ